MVIILTSSDTDDVCDVEVEGPGCGVGGVEGPGCGVGGVEGIDSGVVS